MNRIPLWMRLAYSSLGSGALVLLFIVAGSGCQGLGSESGKHATFMSGATANPSVTLTSSSVASDGVTRFSAIVFTATFSDAVPAFDSSGVSVVNGILSGFSGGGLSYTFLVTPLSEGLVSVSIPEGAARSVHGAKSKSSPVFSFLYDVTPPSVSIGSQPSNPIASHSGTFAFSGTDPDGGTIDHFECAIDGGAFSTCTSPKTFSALVNGSHSAAIRAVDSAGNLGVPEAVTWVTRVPPLIQSVTPQFASTSGGTVIVLHGTDFESSPSISIDGQNCPVVTRTSSTEISCRAPDHAPGTLDIALTNDDGGAGTLASSIVYEAAPAVDEVSPAAIDQSTGGLLTITGSGFSSSNTVMVGDSSCGSVHVASANELTCLASAFTSSGSKPVLVDNAHGINSGAGTVNVSAAPRILALSGTAPRASTLAQSVQLVGLNFTQNSVVSIDEIDCASTTYTSPTQVRCIGAPPLSAGAHTIQVINSDSELSSSFAILYQEAN